MDGGGTHGAAGGKLPRHTVSGRGRGGEGGRREGGGGRREGGRRATEGEGGQQIRPENGQQHCSLYPVRMPK